MEVSPLIYATLPFLADMWASLLANRGGGGSWVARPCFCVLTRESDEHDDPLPRRRPRDPLHHRSPRMTPGFAATRRLRRRCSSPSLLWIHQERSMGWWDPRCGGACGRRGVEGGGETIFKAVACPSSCSFSSCGHLRRSARQSMD